MSANFNPMKILLQKFVWSMTRGAFRVLMFGIFFVFFGTMSGFLYAVTA